MLKVKSDNEIKVQIGDARVECVRVCGWDGDDIALFQGHPTGQFV